MGWEEGASEPIVPRPPTLNFPKRANGVEQVIMLGVTLRMTMTLDGSAGMSLEVMIVLLSMMTIMRIFQEEKSIEASLE